MTLQIVHSVKVSASDEYTVTGTAKVWYSPSSERHYNVQFVYHPKTGKTMVSRRRKGENRIFQHVVIEEQISKALAA